VKNVTEWGIQEWTIIIISTFLADKILQHIAFYVGYGVAVWQIWIFGV
jgi:hypothetical protein